MIVIMLKPGIALLMLGILLMPCAARLPHYSERDFVESVGKVGDWSNRVQQTTQTDLYAKVLGVWNASWPTIVKLKDESAVEYGFPDSSDRPYSLSKSCSEDVRRLGQGLSSQESWALEMVDASGKVPSGLLLGNAKWIGTYGECVGASSKQSQQPENSTVLGEYCLVTIGTDTSASALGIEVAICIPRTCNSTDAMALLNLVLSDITDEIQATKAVCRDNDPLPLDSGAIVVITILSVLGVVLILGTCLDVFQNHCHRQMLVNGHMEDAKNDISDAPLLTDGVESMKQHNFTFLQTDGCLYRFLMAFSVLANAKKVLSLEQGQNEGNLQALNGIRVLSLSWVILGHTFIFGLPQASNGVEFINLIKRFTFQAVINATVSVDTFFVLSGTLLSYFLLKEIRNRGGLRGINWPVFVFHRFWRLTPLYMMVLAIWATLFKYLGSGPYWPQESDKFCKTNWWTNLLYINNIVRKYEVCLSWSWYLSNDTQFYLLSAVLLALLYKWPLFGGIATFVVMLASSITTGVITYVHHYPGSTPGLFQNITSDIYWFGDVYFVPWCRINPYLIGILLGYMLYKTNCKLRMHRALVILGWCLAAVCNLSVLYGLYNVANGHYLSPSINALYGSINRLAWGVGVAWVILACATGNGGVVNDLLSLPIMQPLSRLTFAAYLLHPMVILWYYQNLKVPLFWEDITMVYLFLGHLVLSYLCAFVFSIVFESPMINLERAFLRKRKNQD